MGLEVEQSIRPGELKACKRFEKMLKIGPKSMVSINGAPLEMIYNVNTAVVSISIGDHTAHLVMTEEAWESYIKGAEAKIVTAREFKDSIDLSIKK